MKSYNTMFKIFEWREALGKAKVSRANQCQNAAHSLMFMLMFSAKNFLPLPSYVLPFRTYLWITALGKFSLVTTPISLLLHPHNILTPSLVYVFLICKALSLYLHVALQWPISMESLRDLIPGITALQMLLILYLDPLCHCSVLILCC